LDRRISFTNIATLVARILDQIPAEPVDGWEVGQLLDLDRQVRERAEQNLTRLVG
jgi:1-deoxy-D-xylulose 5-phosphate reductoisomerase